MPRTPGAKNKVQRVDSLHYTLKVRLSEQDLERIHEVTDNASQFAREAIREKLKGGKK